ncbi:hypothetical protein M0804_004910 [Polistes exclamans]|nr:hypothetical protein M0804_004910 [Polistes exclamans]
MVKRKKGGGLLAYVACSTDFLRPLRVCLKRGQNLPNGKVIRSFGIAKLYSRKMDSPDAYGGTTTFDTSSLSNLNLQYVNRFNDNIYSDTTSANE